MWQERVSEFVTLFVVINPLGALPVFLALAGDCNTTARRKLAVKAVVVALVVLAFFAFAGSFLLRHMNITLNAFQIAGASCCSCLRCRWCAVILKQERPVSPRTR